MSINVAIFGASGYSGEELIRILLHHPEVKIAAITSRQYAGQGIETVFPRFFETGLRFVEPNVDAIAADVDAAFLALPHGLAAEYASPLLNKGITVIDISADFRLKDTAKYQKYYKTEHPAPELLPQAIFGQPETHRDELKGAKLVACAGCYVTSVILPTVPLLTSGLAKPSNIIAACMSGVSGAGRKVDLPYIFPECNESVRPYGVTGHRHLPEMEQELARAAGVDELTMNFIPHLIPVNRGIHSTIFMDPARDGICKNCVGGALNKAYADEPFVRVLPHGQLADTKHITMTNMCEIGYAFDEHTGKIILSSAIDNLTKGASGQAVQCMNLALGIDETTGLL